jgi:DNA mismatch repair protein MutS2
MSTDTHNTHDASTNTNWEALNGSLNPTETRGERTQESEAREWRGSHRGAVFDPDSLESLEWDKVTHFLSEQCRTAWGRDTAADLPFPSSRAEVERKLIQLREAMTLWMERGESLPVGHLSELQAAFDRLEKGGHLQSEDLRDIAFLLENVAEVRTYIKHVKEQAPALWELGELLEPLRNLRNELNSCIDPSGFIKDDASWELGSLRETVRQSHGRIRGKLQQYLSSDTSRYLTDTYYTLREDRYVLPVKSNERSKIPGIIYGSSGSGATIFVEPQAMVSLNNALRSAEADVAQEEMRILRKLSELCMRSVHVLRGNMELLGELDLVQARVRFADKLEASLPVLAEPGPEAELKLKQARHPLLILKGIDVVPNDLFIGGKHQVLLLSGPNTGGKTVALKTMGICALMARAALPIPADEGSVVPYLDQVFTDIGDGQSIEHDLSTFSAQIVKLRRFLEQANERTMVLVDEIIVGTNPKQGSCLATVILQELASRFSLVSVTTHYEELKVLPMEDERFANASVGFDLQTLTPTYRIHLGAPGASNGLEIARRLGLPLNLVDLAEKMVPKSNSRFETIMSRLDQQYQELFEERKRAERARQDLERSRLSAQRKEDSLDAMKERIEEREASAMRREMQEVRELIRQTVRELQRGDAGWSKVHRAEKVLQEAKEKAAAAQEKSVKTQRLRKEKKLSVADLNIGQTVKIRSVNNRGEVLEIDPDNDSVMVRVGIMKMRVPLSDLMFPKQNKPSPREQQRSQARKRYKQQQRALETPSEPEESSEVEVTLQTSENTCDLRGKRADEAIDAVEAFLDQAFQKELVTVVLIHGHGTGQLRKAVRNFCRHSTYIHSYRPGQQGEGGEGVTIVRLSL